MCVPGGLTSVAVVQRPEPESFQPPLTPWGHTWRLLATLTISAIAWAVAVPQEEEIGDWFVLLDIGLGVVAFGLVIFRRRWPVTIALVTSLFGTVSGVAAGPALLALVSVATRRRGREIAPVASVNFATAFQFGILTDPEESLWLLLTVNAIGTAAAVGWGLYLGSRRELFWTLQQRAERAEAEQALRVAQARANERARIAREMHDVLAHRISQISLHAGALGFRDDLSAEEMRSSVGVIQEKAHEALTDLRTVLGVLRDSPDGGLTPQPTYADLGALVEEAAAGGMRVTLVEEVAGDVPESMGRTVYRVVQEGITNARKHAPGQPLRIEVTGAPGERLDVTLTNPLAAASTATPGARLGLVGLAERAELAGGRLTHRVDRGSFVLHAWIPWAP